MTNDNTPPPIEDRFTTTLSELVAACLAAGIHPMHMIGPLKKHLAEARQLAMPRKQDEERAEAEGFKRATEADMRKALELDPHEKLPPLRDE